MKVVAKEYPVATVVATLADLADALEPQTRTLTRVYLDLAGRATLLDRAGYASAMNSLPALKRAIDAIGGCVDAMRIAADALDQIGGE